MRANGFTYIEFLMALALTAAISAAGYGSLRANVRWFARVDEAHLAEQEAEAALSLIASDFRTAYLGQESDTFFVGRLENGRSICELWRMSPDPTGRPFPVAYSVESDSVSGRLELRRRSPTGISTAVAHVAEFQLQFFDGESWRREWGWNAEQKKPSVGIRGLPAAVKVRLSTGSGPRARGWRRTLPVMTSLLNRSLGG